MKFQNQDLGCSEYARLTNQKLSVKESLETRKLVSCDSMEVDIMKDSWVDTTPLNRGHIGNKVVGLITYINKRRP